MPANYKPHVGYHRDTDEKNRSLKDQGFYHSPAWRRLRKAALERDHYLCQLRIVSECTTLATEVHHKKPVKDAPDLALDLDNLTSCCWYCHEATKQRRRALGDASSAGVRVIAVGDCSEDDDE